MFTRNKVFVIVAVLLIGVGGISYAVNSFKSFTSKEKEIVINNESFSNIDILTSNATVQVIPTMDRQTTVSYTEKKKRNGKFDFQAKVKGDNLTVLLKERRGFFNFGGSLKDVELVVHVPEKEYNKISVETDNGRIKMEALQGKEFVLSTDNGRIELKNIIANKLMAYTDNGDISLVDVEGEIVAETDNGRITMKAEQLDRAIELTTDNGRIEIETAEEPTNAIINAKTDNGRIEIFGSSNEQTTFGKGEHVIKLKTDNGRITVTK